MSDPAQEPELTGRPLLRRLLSERNQNGDQTEIDARIRAAFEREVAVLVLDMVGFSRISQKHGIIHYLAMIARMDLAARPAVSGNGGRVIKQEADNLFAVFPTSADALEAALDIFRGFEAINGVTPSDQDIRGCIGIGYGPTLIIGDDDIFGCEVNLASKLGEDIAGASEIILTEAAHAALPLDVYRFDPAHFTISGLELDCHYFRGKVRSIDPEIAPTEEPGRLLA